MDGLFQLMHLFQSVLRAEAQPERAFGNGLWNPKSPMDARIAGFFGRAGGASCNIDFLLFQQMQQYFAAHSGKGDIENMRRAAIGRNADGAGDFHQKALQLIPEQAHMAQFFFMISQVFPGGLGKCQNAKGIFRSTAQRTFLAAAQQKSPEGSALFIEENARPLQTVDFMRTGSIVIHLAGCHIEGNFQKCLNTIGMEQGIFVFALYCSGKSGNIVDGARLIA